MSEPGYVKIDQGDDISLFSSKVSNECKSTTEFANTITLAEICIHACTYCYIIMLSFVYCSCDKIKCIYCTILYS